MIWSRTNETEEQPANVPSASVISAHFRCSYCLPRMHHLHYFPWRLKLKFLICVYIQTMLVNFDLEIVFYPVLTVSEQLVGRMNAQQLIATTVFHYFSKCLHTAWLTERLGVKKWLPPKLCLAELIIISFTSAVHC